MLTADAWGQTLVLHTDPGRAAPEARRGWVEAYLQLDADEVPRRGLARLACEVDGRYIVHIRQPDVLPLAEVDALADAVVAAFRGQCLEGLLIDQIHPGGTAPSDAHRGYRARTVVVFFTARASHEVRP